MWVMWFVAGTELADFSDWQSGLNSDFKLFEFLTQSFKIILSKIEKASNKIFMLPLPQTQIGQNSPICVYHISRTKKEQRT